MAETKNEAFHRLAKKRVETITDAIRIFSNLCSPAYEFTAAEVLAYAGQIEQALAEGLARFRDTKCWRLAPPPHPVLDVAISIGEELEAEGFSGDPDLAVPLGQAPQPEIPLEEIPEIFERKNPKRLTIGEVLREVESAPNQIEALADMVSMQRLVIDNLKEQLSGQPTVHP